VAVAEFENGGVGLQPELKIETAVKKMKNKITAQNLKI
jgi:hypothetical protein